MKSKTRNILLAVFIATSVILAGTLIATYSYLIAGTQNIGANTNLIVESKTVDNLTFNSGQDLSLIITQDNLAPGAGDVTSSTTSTVTFTARNDAQSSGYYRAYLFIDSTFSYTANGTPEIVLSVTKNGVDVINNYDITMYKGMIEINSEYCGNPGGTGYDSCTKRNTITATAGQTTTDTWVATVTFKNLNSNQKLNTNKSLQAKLYFDTAPLLPEGYTEYKYVQPRSGIGAYIDTGLAVYNNSNFEIDLAFGLPSVSHGVGPTYLYGHATASQNARVNTLYLYDTYLYDTNVVSLGATYPLYVRYQVKKSTGTITYNTLASNGSISNKSSMLPADNLTSENLLLFKHGSNISDYRIYNCKIYINGALERNFVPCYRTSDGNYGLYDTVYGVFYTNMGAVWSGGSVAN